jgi:Tol biopolymer transport system component
MPDSRHLLLNVASDDGIGHLEIPRNLPDWLFYFDIQTNVYTILQDKFESKIEDFSPDGKSFVYFDPKYVENNTTPVSVALGFISGDPPIQLTNNDLHIFWADVTPDGQKLAVFASDPAIPYNPAKDFPCFSPLHEAYLLNLSTKERQDYSIKGKNAVSSVRLSPDGKKIVYANAEGRLCSENFPIYILDLESGLNERLKVGGLEVGWSPDGSKLAVVQMDVESQHSRRQIIIYDLLSKLILNTFYNTDIDKEGATLFWVTVNSSARQQ